MEIQLEQYFQQSLPKHSIIDQSLTPLLSRVRKANINSIHQLNKQFTIDHGQDSKEEAASPVMDKTKKIFWYQPRTTSLRQQLREKGNLTARARFYSVHDNPPKRLSKTSCNPQQRTIARSPLSKVRRHLVDYIDFKELQRAMYKKSTKINVFQHFCNSIRQRSQSQAEKKRVSSQKNYSKDEWKSESEREDFPCGESGLKITYRKKFWRRGQSYRHRDSEGNQCLKVKRFFNTLS